MVVMFTISDQTCEGEKIGNKEGKKGQGKQSRKKVPIIDQRTGCWCGGEGCSSPHSPIARVITWRRLRTSFTTSLFCRGVARQQITAWHQAVSSRNCLCRFSCRANSRVFPVMMSPARGPESLGELGCGRSCSDACSRQPVLLLWSSFRIVLISISQASWKQEAKVSLRVLPVARADCIYHSLAIPFSRQLWERIVHDFTDFTALLPSVLGVCAEGLNRWEDLWPNSTVLKGGRIYVVYQLSHGPIVSYSLIRPFVNWL